MFDPTSTAWCQTNDSACNDQSRLRTDNTTNRATYTTTTNMSSHDANLYAYGNYYNWYSATAGNGKYSTGTGTTVSGDLCPTGWHLPTGHSSNVSLISSASGEFGLLSNSLGGRKNANNIAQTMAGSTTPTSTIMLKRIHHFPINMLYSGNANGASISNRGEIGFFWSSTRNDNIYMYELRTTTSTVGTNVSGHRIAGRSVRCLLQE